MENKTITTKQFGVFMAIAFGVAYIPLILAGIQLKNGNMIAFALLFRVIAVFIPLIAVLIARVPFKSLGFKIKVGFGKFFLSLMGAQLLSYIGAGIFFLIFRDKWELSLNGLLANFPAEYSEVFNSLELDPKMMLPMMFLSSLAAVPISQIIPSLGEEAGWRGVMYPFLKKKFGKLGGRIIGGFLWGIWHWPLVILGGHFYGTEYWGAPVLGPIAICITLTAFGILIDHLYEKTGSILMASLSHSGMNAAAVPMMLISVTDPHLSILGPTCFALIPIIPVIIADIVISAKKDRQSPVC